MGKHPQTPPAALTLVSSKTSRETKVQTYLITSRLTQLYNTAYEDEVLSGDRRKKKIPNPTTLKLTAELPSGIMRFTVRFLWLLLEVLMYESVPSCRPMAVD